MKLCLLVPLAAAALLVGCDGGDTTESRAGETPSPAATTATPPAIGTPTPVAVPEPPQDFADYPQAIADYLTAAGPQAMGPPCLAELFEAWDMPDTGDELRCLTANTDDDAEYEMVVVLSASSADPAFPEYTTVRSSVVVLEYGDEGYEVVFEYYPVEWPSDFGLPSEAVLLAAGDINIDGNGELVYADSECGAHTCFSTVHIVSGRGSGYDSLSEEGFNMAYPDISLKDVDDDGAKELVMHGGMIGSIGAGPQRARTEVYAWDGTQYVLTSTTYDETNSLYLRILDADAVFTEGRYQDALLLYRAALDNRSLELWKDTMGWEGDERAEMDSYLRFRIALCIFAAGGSTDEAMGEMENAALGYPGSRHAEMAQAFLDSYLAKETLSIACQAARGYVLANADEFQAIWDYGYANPALDPDLVCPF